MCAAHPRAVETARGCDLVVVKIRLHIRRRCAAGMEQAIELQVDYPIVLSRVTADRIVGDFARAAGNEGLVVTG